MQIELLIYAGSLFLVVYCLLLYPAFCALLGTANQVDGPLNESDLPGISVLLAAYNEESVIAAKIKNFLALDYPEDRIELIIVDDESTDQTREIINRFESKRIRLLPLRKRAGKAVAVNRLTEAASHPFFLLCDANVMFDSLAAKNLVRHFTNPKIGAVTGQVDLTNATQDIRAGESFYYMLERRVQNSEGWIGSLIGVDGGMYMMRRSLYGQLPGNTILDDFAISMQVIRSGHKIIYDSEALAVESGTPSSTQEFNRRVRMMSGVSQILRMGLVPKWSQPIIWWQFWSHKILRWIFPFLLLALFVSSGVLWDDFWVFKSTFLLLLGTLGTLALSCASRRFRQSAIGSIVFYFYLSQIASMYGFVKGWAIQQKGYWEKGQRAVKPLGDQR